MFEIKEAGFGDYHCESSDERDAKGDETEYGKDVKVHAGFVA
jgi:hypothetical protein